ncbi:MAG: hypothetical protein H6799_00205 [Candidatus Nomurabacteria bacterium]|nr:MAG: hypothetical protein H6799_00205 [Candidatus Nomurabacteria bacterium]HRV76366.1 hypothetical protein [Candidatus Saccharimonadales bacterium]
MRRVGKSLYKKLSRFLYTRFRRYATWPTWRLFFSSLFFLVIGIFFLRSNNITALEKYRDVIKADENNGSVYEKLNDLQRYTFGHLNSGVERPVQLVNTYNRDANKLFDIAQAKLNASGLGEKDVYLEAQKACEAKGIPITARAQCAADYVLSNNPSINAEQLKVNLPDKSLYSFTFSSPRWAWDAAGISLFISVLFFLGAIFRMLLAWYLRKRLVKWEYRYS